MKKLWGWIGTGVFWVLWPVWVVYFKFSGTRSRVLVVCDDEVLLLQGWLGVKEWNLPGGGVKKGETIEAGAVRELAEETGIMINESNLTRLGRRQHNRYGLRYKAEFFVVHLAEKPTLTLSRHEIFAGKWVRLSRVETLALNDDARYALKRYTPTEQASLL
jgi:8-oxo-dGTP pyrophosphatase MutT (NUDIX family)